MSIPHVTIVLLCAAALRGVNAFEIYNPVYTGMDDGLFHPGGGPASRGSILPTLLIRAMDGDLEGRLPNSLTSALSSRRVPVPLLRAVISRHMPEIQTQESGFFRSIMASRHTQETMLRDLVLFKMTLSEMGKAFLRGAVEQKEGRKYTFGTHLQVGKPYEYIDEHGRLTGFLFDFIDEVCKVAKRNCVLQHSPFYDCNFVQGEHLAAGKGLLSGKYDMCLSWFNTSERRLSVSFTQPFWSFQNSGSFLVKKGNPDNFNPNDIEGEKIGFIHHLSSNPTCLRTAKSIVGAHSFSDENAVVLEVLNVIPKDFETNKVEAVFMYPSTNLYNPDEFDIIGEAVPCSEKAELGGFTRKGYELKWFDEAFEEMKKSGKYYKLCKETERKHGSRASCL
ncbi:uncharacterized protein [Ptychodera flava]|uniref:uncharacterized protein n=1 Tax=Ptychodera flava TaxID=63121 RepID=UPI00396A2E1E